MTEPGGPGRILLVDGSPAEAAALAALPGARVASAAAFEDEAANGVVAVVVGSATESPVGLAQRAHRAVPDAGVAVVTGDPDVRRRLSYSPGVPIGLLVLAPSDDLAARVAALRDETVERREHRALLARLGAPREPAAEVRPAGVRLHALLEHAPLGILVCDPDGRLLGWNRAADDLLTLSPASVGAPVDRAVPGAADLVANVDRTPEAVELTAAGDVEVEVSAVASELDDGRRVALLLVVDVTTRRQAERARDRLAGHVELLADVSDVLTRTLDPAQAVELLARALVPALGDWVGIGLTAEYARFGIVTVHHRDPARIGVAERTRQRLVNAAGAIDGRVLRGESALLTDADLPGNVSDPELVRLYQELGTTSLVAVPLRGRTDVLGFLVVASSSTARDLTETELAVALEVGRRAGTALDNARLYARQRQLAGELQRSLLTEPPTPSYASIEVRYVAAAQQSQVGGDWYDAFVQPDGATVLVIGDVVGHDTRAAAAMGQLRGLLRGIAYTTGAEPAEVLTRVDAAIEGLLLGTTATAVVARLSPVPGSGSGAAFRLAWSNAGHPPPIVVGPEGSIDVLAPGDADLLLGFDAGTPRRTSEVTLPAGSTVLLYTDGLVERRGQSLDDGIRELTAVLAASPTLPLTEMCDSALAQMLPDDPEDDVALVAVRVAQRPPHSDV